MEENKKETKDLHNKFGLVDGGKRPIKTTSKRVISKFENLYTV